MFGSLLAGCGSSSAVSPQATVRSFLASWTQRNWEAMSRLVDRPPANFANINATALADLGVSKANYVAGPVNEQGQTATAQITERFHLAGIGSWTVHTTLHLKEQSARWLVEWSPATIDQALSSKAHFAVATTWPPRAPILGAGGVPLTTEDAMVIIGVEGHYVTDPTSLAAALISAGASTQPVNNALIAAKVNPTYFEPVFTVTRAHYLQFKPTLYPIPGAVFQATSARAAITPGLSAHLVGSVGPITAQELHELGAPYDASSVVVQTGLEQVYESQLAGVAGATISVVDANGATTATLTTIAPKPGKALETSIDPAVQKAAELALAGEPKNPALVAVRASTGQVLASVSDPSSDGFDQALDGTFPPGSTFKTITSTALIDAGLSPHGRAACREVSRRAGSDMNALHQHEERPRGASDAIEIAMSFAGQTVVVLRSVLVASAALAFGSATTAAVPSTSATGGRTTAPRFVESSRTIKPAGCPHLRPSVGSPTVLPVRIVHLGKGAVALASVCIEGAGPFPFLIDSGSALSVVDKQLSQRFHLRQIATPEQAAGIACSATVVPEQISNWSLSGLTLSAQEVIDVSLPNLEKSQPLAGVIGSDVLSRFGSVRIDYRAQTLSLGGAEIAPPTGNEVLHGPTSTPTPAPFLTKVRVDAAATVVTQKGAVGVYAPIRFDRSGTQLFIVDTGAEISMVSPALAHALHLVATQQAVSLSATIGCPVSLIEVQSGRWTLGSASLEPQLIARLPASGLKANGLLGSDVLSRYGAVVIDYRGARILLESG